MANAEVMENVDQEVEKRAEPGIKERWTAFKQSWIHHATVEVPLGARVGLGIGSFSANPAGVAIGTGIGALAGGVIATGHTIHDYFKKGGVKDQVKDGTWDVNKGVLYNAGAGAVRVAGKVGGDLVNEGKKAVDGAAASAKDGLGNVINDAKVGLGNFINDATGGIGNTMSDMWNTVKPFLPVMAVGGIMTMFGSGGNIFGSLGAVAGIGLACVLAKNTGLLDTLGKAFNGLTNNGTEKTATADVDKAMADSMESKSAESKQMTQDMHKEQTAVEQQKVATAPELA